MKLFNEFASAAAKTKLMEQRVSLLENPPVSRHVRDGLLVRLRKDDVEKAPASVWTAAHESEILRPEEHHRADAEHRACGTGLPIDGCNSRHPAGGCIALKADGERDVRGGPRDVRLGEGAILVPEQEVAAGGGTR